MQNLNDVDTVYTRKFKTISLKLKQQYQNRKGPEASNPEQVYEVLKQIYNLLDDDQEHLVLLVLNVGNIVTGYKVVSVGGQSGVLNDEKVIFRNAILLGAAKIMIAHNHPSGLKAPSMTDVQFTKRLIEIGSLLKLPLLDHFILGDQGYLSMRTFEFCQFEDMK